MFKDFETILNTILVDFWLCSFFFSVMTSWFPFCCLKQWFLKPVSFETSGTFHVPKWFLNYLLWLASSVLVASILWNVVHVLYFSFHFTTFQHFISQTPAWEARQLFTWNQSWETKLVCEVNIFTFRNPIPTGASNWPLLVLAVQASSLLSDQGASGKLFLLSSCN